VSDTQEQDADIYDVVVIGPGSTGKNVADRAVKGGLSAVVVDVSNAEPSVELQPVFLDEPPHDWGIRSARFLLTESEYVRSVSPRTFVSAALLAALVTGDDDRRRDVDPSRYQAFTTWLGLRYDRPAVPPTLLPLAKRISEEVTRRRHRSVGRRVRDVLMQFDEGTSLTRFSLFAILVDEEDKQEVREWLADIAWAIPATFGIADQIEAATAAGTSFQLVETSYAADVSSLTWRPGDPQPGGQRDSTCRPQRTLAFSPLTGHLS
jgi:hypothetical protein